MSNRKKRRPPGSERTEQQNLLTETQYANPGVPRDLSSNQLTSGLPYQRPVESEDVDRLIAKWDDRLLTPLVVSFRDGKFNVVDGQHRIAAMRKMADGGNITVPCLIYTGLSYEQEAELYFKLDQSKGRLRLSHATKALLESGTDAEVLEIKRLSVVDPEEIIRRGKMDFSTNKAALRFARVILEKYNSQQRGGHKLPYRFKG